MSYMDHFGKQSSAYLQFRPDYPDKLYHYLSTVAFEHQLAWDCGTGNGQAAIKLADHFTKVVGSDLNQKQLDVALKKANIDYHCWPAGKTEFKNHSVDLITVAQALHWFKFDEFYREVRRVSKDNGIIAAWCYPLGKINEEVDVVIKKLYANILGNAYWPKERHYIDDGYQTIPFPFHKIQPPNFIIEKPMDFTQLMGYLNTWSAVKEYQRINQDNPINLIYHELQTAWGDPSKHHTMQWPIHLLVGKVNE